MWQFTKQLPAVSLVAAFFCGCGDKSRSDVQHHGVAFSSQGLQDHRDEIEERSNALVIEILAKSQSGHPMSLSDLKSLKPLATVLGYYGNYGVDDIDPKYTTPNAYNDFITGKLPVPPVPCGDGG
jgi:hypothetical protein